MATETNIPEDASSMSPSLESPSLVESITNIEAEEIKFAEKNANDLNCKYPLVEETRQADSDETGEISKSRTQEIFQESSQASVESEKQAEHHSEGYSMENMIIKHLNTEGQLTMEIIPKSSAAEHEVPTRLPTVATVKVETVEHSLLEESLKQTESTLVDNKSHTAENEVDENTEVLEAFDLLKTTGNTCAENEKQAEPQLEAQKQETMIINHTNSEGLMTTEISPKICNDTEEFEQVPKSHFGEKLETKVGGEIIPEEGKEVEEATDIQLQISATESVPDDESPSTLSTMAFFRVDTVEKTFQKETHKEDESTEIVDDQSRRPENVVGQYSNVLEAIDLPKTMVKAFAENEEHVDHQSEVQGKESMIIKHTNLEELATMEISTKSSYDAKELEKVPESENVEKLEIKDNRKITPAEAKDLEETTDMQLQTSETESVFEDETFSTLPTIASVRLQKIVQKCIQEEIQKEDESTVTDIYKSNRPEINVEDNGELLEAFDQVKTTSNSCVENEKKVEPQYEVQSQETSNIKHANSGGLLTIEIAPKSCCDSEELEKVPRSHTGEKIEIKDCGIIKPEETKETEEATDLQLQEPATESVPDKNAPSTLPTVAFVRVEKLEESFQEERFKEDESTVLDNDKRCRPENDVEQNTKVLEAIDLPETMVKACEEIEEKAEQQFEVRSQEVIIINHANCEGLVTTALSPIYKETEELEKLPESQSGEKIETNDGGKITTRGEKNMEEVTDMQLQNPTTESAPDEEAPSTLSTIAFVRVEKLEESFQEETLKDEYSIVQDNDKSCRPENDVEQNAEVSEAIDVSETMFKPCEEIEEQPEQQFDAQSQETMVIRHTNSEGLVTTKISPQYNVTEECEKFSNSHEEKLEVKDGGKITTKEARETEEATVMQLQKSETECIPKDEALSTSPTLASVEDEIVEKCFQEERQKERKSTVTDNDQNNRPEYDTEKNTQDLQVFDLPKTSGHTCTENKMTDEPQYEAQRLENIENTSSARPATTEITPKSCNDILELDKAPESLTGEKLEIKDCGIIIPEKAKEIDKETHMQLPDPAKESIPDEEAQSTLPTIAIARVEKLEESCQEETLEYEESTLLYNDKSPRAENDVGQNTKADEEIDLPKSIVKACTDDEEEAKQQSDVENQETTIINETSSEGQVTREMNPKYNETEELENFPESHAGEKLEINDGGKITTEEAKDTEEAIVTQLLKSETECVPEDETLSTLPTIASVEDETIERCAEDEGQKQHKSSVTDNDKTHIPENDVEEDTENLKAADLNKKTSNTSTENEKKVEPQSEVQSPETKIPKNTNSEELVTSEIIPKSCHESEENEKVPDPHSVEKLEIKDCGIIIPEEAKEMKEATDNQFQNPATESVPDKEAPPPTEFAGVEKVEESYQEEMLKVDESTMLDNDELETRK